MKFITIRFFFILTVIPIWSCKETAVEKAIDEETWKLGWRMIENSWDDNLELAEMQFDSLLALDKPIGTKFLIDGCYIKVRSSKEEEALKIIENQPEEIQIKICQKKFAQIFEPCFDLPKENIENRKLQLEIIDLFLDDQAIRGNLMKDFISKYDIDTTNIIVQGEIKVDDKNRDQVKEIFWNYGFSDDELAVINEYIDSQPEGEDTMKDIIAKHNMVASSFISPSMGVTDSRNQNRLEEIIQEFGFPTLKLIGKDAMRGVFFIIQHADRDREWQKLQLPYIEQGTKSGAFSKQDYAFLYDRIQVNSVQDQRYGSQCANVDRKNNIVELQDTEDLPNLDNRRREMDMMPIALYKKMMLRN